MTTFGYARVSTQDQDLAYQREQLKDAGCEQVFEEKLSGKDTKRPQLKLLLATAQSGDLVIVTRLDRLARSTLDLLTTLQHFKERGVQFKSLSDAWADSSTPMGNLIIQIIAALAEFERHLIMDRTQAGIKRAKERGVRFGCTPKMTDEQRAEARARLAAGETHRKIALSYGVSNRTIARLLEGEAAPRKPAPSTVAVGPRSGPVPPPGP